MSFPICAREGCTNEVTNQPVRGKRKYCGPACYHIVNRAQTNERHRRVDARFSLPTERPRTGKRGKYA